MDANRLSDEDVATLRAMASAYRENKLAKSERKGKRDGEHEVPEMRSEREVGSEKLS